MLTGKKACSLIFLLVILSIGIFINCSKNPLADGGSSGVDNPQLAFTFHDESGLNIRLSGSVSLYAENLNPVNNSIPLAKQITINSAKVYFSASDINPAIQALTQKITLNKKSAFSIAGDSLIRFNAVLASDANSGNVIFHIRYNKNSNQFEDSIGNPIGKYKIQAKALKSVILLIDRSKIPAGNIHVYIQGTPYQAQGSGNTITMYGLPTGKYIARVISPTGEIYKLSQYLDTQVNKSYSLTDTTGAPIETTIVVKPGVNQAPKVNAGIDKIVNKSDSTFMLVGFVSDDTLPLPHNITQQWSQISGPNFAIIHTPENLNTRVNFSAEGNYIFQLTVSDGILSSSDTIKLAVINPQVSTINIISPRLGDTLFTNSISSIRWRYDIATSVRIDLSINGGSTWALVDTAVSMTGVENNYSWTLPSVLSPSDSTLQISSNCMVRLTTKDGKYISGLSNGSFTITR